MFTRILTSCNFLLVTQYNSSMSEPKKRPQASLVKVAENLYRNESSGTYYALVKRSGKQNKRSLKTKDRKLAERRLRTYKNDLERMDPAKGKVTITFKEMSERWLETIKPHLKDSTYTEPDSLVVTIQTGKKGIEKACQDLEFPHFNRKDGSGSSVVVTHEIGTKPGLLKWVDYLETNDPRLKIQGEEVIEFPKYEELKEIQIKVHSIQADKGHITVKSAEIVT